MRRWDVYRGQRFGNSRLPAVLLFVAVFLLLAFVVLFFTLPGYLVYTRDEVHLNLPFLRGETAKPEETGTEPEETLTIEEAVAEIEVKSPDYSHLALANDGEGLEIIQSVYVPYEQVNDAGLTKAVGQARALEAGGLTLELSDETGVLLWVSETDTAVNYALNGTLDLSGTVEQLKSQGYYLTAVISCCVNSTLVSRNPTLALTGAGGYVYSDQRGAWMDPWNADVRQYTIDLTKELMEMGFDEVVLNHVEHPTTEVGYTRTMSGELTRTSCVTNFAIAVRKAVQETMDATGARLSAMMDTTALNDETVDNGQSLAYFLQIFDRVYEFTETYSEANQVIALHVDSTERFVPIISWTFPGGSWAQNFFESVN